jgi:hypothetical protein
MNAQSNSPALMDEVRAKQLDKIRMLQERLQQSDHKRVP